MRDGDRDSRFGVRSPDGQGRPVSDVTVVPMFAPSATGNACSRLMMSELAKGARNEVVTELD